MAHNDMVPPGECQIGELLQNGLSSHMNLQPSPVVNVLSGRRLHHRHAEPFPGTLPLIGGMFRPHCSSVDSLISMCFKTAAILHFAGSAVEARSAE
jgi:hypothetical protein